MAKLISAKKKSIIKTIKPIKLPEYGEMVKIMQGELASVMTDYVQQYIGASSGEAIYINPDWVGQTQSYLGAVWYDLYDRVENEDTQVKAVVESAKVDIAGMSWSIDPYKARGEDEASDVNKRNADIVLDVFEKIPNLPVVFHGLMDALVKGFSVSEVIWGEDFYIKEVINRTQRRFQFNANDRTLRVRDKTSPYFGQPLPDRKFIVHRISSTWGNPFGDALVKSIYWMWIFKRTVIKFSMKHLEVGASSIPVVKHPQGASAELKAEALAIAEMIRNGAYGRVPDNFEIIYAEAKNVLQNSQSFDSFIKYCDDQISKVVQGQTLTTDTGQSGTRAQGEVHQQTATTRDIFRARGLQETLNATVIKWITDIHVGEVEGYPQFRFDLEESDDLVTESEIVNNLSSAGYDFDEGELSKKFNYTLKKKSELQTNELGKLPLAIQQLALARTRAEESGDKILSKQIGAKIDELLNKLTPIESIPNEPEPVNE